MSNIWTLHLVCLVQLESNLPKIPMWLIEGTSLVEIWETKWSNNFNTRRSN